MNFNNTDDIKDFIRKIIDNIDTKYEFYQDFIWFSNVNYTTTTEYFGELRLFLKKLIFQNKIPCYTKEINELITSLDKIFEK